eukprot:10484766-Ditylum_brightwellii.AAC.1
MEIQTTHLRESHMPSKEDPFGALSSSFGPLSFGASSTLCYAPHLTVGLALAILEIMAKPKQSKQ